ncbi:MAG: DUF402 domain-containing protein [Anaerolineae bacterium]|nr:DUF402 domain-containing protein [Anaerolineae bacterium]MDW8173898.1 DUF402 domain-containing protein [Anaerolineae bacterium]
MNYTIHKCDYLGQITLSYQGEVVAQGAGWVCVVAPFGFADRDLGYIVLKRGDIFTEWFYADRYYNIFAIHDRDDGALKGYYCNFTRPALLQANSLRADDLALDLFVAPDGSTRLLDEDEYAALPLDSAERQRVAEALAELRQLIVARAHPFDELA